MADRRMDMAKKNCRFSQVCEKRLKLESIFKQIFQGYSTAVAYISTFCKSIASISVREFQAVQRPSQ